MTTRQRLVVIGGDAAGMSAAAQARRRRTKSELEIVAFEQGEYTSYSACGLPYLIGNEVEDVDDLVVRSREQHHALGVDVRTGHEVLGIDLDARVVHVLRHADGDTHDEPFDKLVIGTGALPIRPDIPNVAADGVHGVQNLADGIALKEYVDGLDRDLPAVVVGGGYIGLELAEAMKTRGREVTVIDRSAQPMSTLDPDMGALVADAIRGIGIDLRTETAVEGFEVGADGTVAAVVTDAGSIPAKLVVLGIGVEPNAGLAAAAGITIGPSGGIATDRRMATSADGVWAAGDCVETYHRVSRGPVAIALGTHANKQGRVAGTNAAGGYAHFGGVLGTAVTKICAYEIGRTGLNEEEAHAAGFAFETATIESTTRAGYYPGAQPITVKVLAELGTGRLLGAQIIGREGAAKRVDVMAAAIWNEMAADEFVQLDLGYAPPFSPLWDPTLIAARKVGDAVRAAAAADSG